MPKTSPELLFGQEIRLVRERAGLSQEELGFRAGIHCTYVSQLERGLKSPTLRVIMRLAQTLDVEAAELVSAAERSLPVKKRGSAA